MHVHLQYKNASLIEISKWNNNQSLCTMHFYLLHAYLYMFKYDLCLAIGFVI